MKQEQALECSLEHPDYLVIAGSKLYGTDTPESDHDLRGLVVPPFEYLIGLSRFDQRVIRKPDTVIYSIGRTFELLIKGDPLLYEILFAPKPNIAECTNVGKILRHNRKLFASEQFARRIMGYAQSEWRKVTGTQLVPIKRTTTENQIIENIRKVFRPNKTEMDKLIHLLFINRPKETQPARRKLGAKRKLQIKHYGYCTSSASHTIRLLGQLKELTETGGLTFPRPNAKLLLEIKRGTIKLEKVTEIYRELLYEAQQAESKTNLPRRAPINKIKNIFYEIIAATITQDKRVSDYIQAYNKKWGQSINFDKIISSVVGIK